MFAVANQGGQMSRAGLRARSFHLLVDPTGVWLTPPGSVGEMAVRHFAGFAMFLVGALVFIAIHSRRPPTAGPLRESDRSQSQRERQWIRIRRFSRRAALSPRRK